MASLATTNNDLEAIIARTALKYDLLPYQSKPFAQSQPARLGAIARLFALDAAPMEKARVLELGCASGGNIIPHAMRYPNATFVGVDLARTQVAAGRSRIAQLGLKNIEIHCQSFTEIGDELGQFDYVICHGVYSWVPAMVQDAIFRIVSARLSPVGVACISYNVLPGWRMMQPLRDAFLLQVPDHVDSLGRVAQARELLNFLKDTLGARRSTVTVGFAYTQLKQLLVYFPFQLFPHNQKYWIQGEAGYYRYVYYFFGVGNDIGVGDD